MSKVNQSASALRAPSLGLLATEPLRALLDFCATKLCAIPRSVGDGHDVIVYPGLGGGPLSTVTLRNFLRDSGFAAHDWSGGLNTGPDGAMDTWLVPHVDRVRELHARNGRKVSLVGWSLGGVYAREIAKLCPEAVRQVITLATPFAAMGEANHAGTIFKLLGGDTSQLTPELQAHLQEAPAVPTTSIFSKSDGLVAWRGCLQREGAQTQNVEVTASHLGMVTNPEVMRVVLDRLQVPEGTWRPYRARRMIKPAIARGRSRT